MGKPPFELSVDQRAVARVARAMRYEEDGKALRKELATDLKAAVQPGVTAVQGKLRAIPRAARGTAASPPLGAYLAQRVKPQVRLGGRSTGVAVRIPRTPRLRGFAFAAKRLNRTHWRHRVYGSEVWVTQESPMPGYFDDTLQQDRQKYRKAVVAALEKMARRVAQRARG